MMAMHVLKAGLAGRARTIFAATALILTGANGAAAAADTPFGGMKHDSSQPIEIVSDSLEVRQADQVAVFSGAVEAKQGKLVLTADQLDVHFDQNSGGDAGNETGAIRKVIATGSVFLTTGDETAQGSRAEYDVTSGTIRMTGDVILNQGANAIKGEALNIDLNRGFGRMESSSGGRVKSVFTPGTAQ
jgi:lipopolysaccharide export system protein LptA